jgi:purine-binding chemotaxis protein CheW
VSAKRLYCTFFLDDLYFGVEVLKVQEVLRHRPMTRVPLGPPSLRGLINLRGQIVPAIDLRPCLQRQASPSRRVPLNVVVRTDEGPMSLLVDEIGDVLEVGEDTFERSPGTLTGVARELILGAHKLADRLLVLLDLEKAIQFATQGTPQRLRNTGRRTPCTHC